MNWFWYLILSADDAPLSEIVLLYKDSGDNELLASSVTFERLSTVRQEISLMERSDRRLVLYQTFLCGTCALSMLIH